MDNWTLRGTLSVIAGIGLLMIGGCRICDSCDDCAYPTYGGSWERTNRNHGRVGSIFAPAGAKVAATYVTAPLETETPTPDASIDQDNDAEEDGDTRSLLDELEDDLPVPEADEPLDET